MIVTESDITEQAKLTLGSATAFSCDKIKIKKNEEKKPRKISTSLLQESDIAKQAKIARGSATAFSCDKIKIQKNEEKKKL